jgi:hypothetical protein
MQCALRQTNRLSEGIEHHCRTLHLIRRRLKLIRQTSQRITRKLAYLILPVLIQLPMAPSPNLISAVGRMPGSGKPPISSLLPKIRLGASKLNETHHQSPPREQASGQRDLRPRIFSFAAATHEDQDRSHQSPVPYAYRLRSQVRRAAFTAYAVFVQQPLDAA